ncbi:MULTISPECIES: FAD-dependent oxidoreductase [Leuconostoc]|uniref:FAD-dependent oxidoreductase n=1 Tax=Leuconostoc TaxID=1243 RepID=UPI0011BB7373|nr:MULTISPECIES: FAD-dependent oxidoreductase [Leuconostoc]MCP1275705.1 FAD-dependent oxidoreductase [Leuconostoc citreum]QEA55065.1 FAD-dependent oxidoreductase [Leuconostoc citreum]QOG10709.1 FAD-dependent oxidoreductase [Leuconostoc sp. LN180020]
MSKTKVIVVGASHGGHQAILELTRQYPELDIKLFEAGDFVSFMSCGMELYLEDSVTNVNDVRNFSPENISHLGAEIYNNSEVIAINTQQKTVTVRDTTANQTQEYDYDKLILSSGVTPKRLPVAGSTLENVYLMRGKDWATKIKAKLEDPSVQNITVVGAGYIGIEAVEASVKAGKNVTLIDVIDRPLGNYLNAPLTTIIEKELKDNGVTVITGANIQSFEGQDKVTAVKTNNNNYPTDLVIQAVGVQPNTSWLDGVVALDNRGWIKTDEYLRTNVSDVYAVGDAVLSYSIPAQTKLPIALASVVRRQVRYVITHLFENQPALPFNGVVGSSALSVFNYRFATAGLNTTTAEKANVTLRSAYYQDQLRPNYVPKSKGNCDVYVTLDYEPQTHRLLGGAVLSTYDITAQGNVIALAIQHHLRLEDLAEADFFFQPEFDRQWSLLNLAAQHALGEPAF